MLHATLHSFSDVRSVTLDAGGEVVGEESELIE